MITCALDGVRSSRTVVGESGAAAPSLPSRTEFGHDHYTYIGGERMRIGVTRTMRPAENENGAMFRHRINALAQQLLPCGTLTVDEEIRGGVVVQAILRLQIEPEAAPILDDTRRAGGRPSGPRGSRGGA